MSPEPCEKLPALAAKITLEKVETFLKWLAANTTVTVRDGNYEYKLPDQSTIMRVARASAVPEDVAESIIKLFKMHLIAITEIGTDTR